MSRSLPGAHRAQDLPVQYIKGIGPKRAAALADVGITTLGDLLYHVPRRYLDRTSIVSVAELRRRGSGLVQLGNGGEAPADAAGIRKDDTVVGAVRSFRVVGTGRAARFILVLADQTGSLQCVWFGGVQYWRRAFAVGEVLAVSGQPAFYRGVLQFVHPDIDRISPGKEELEEGQPVDWGSALHTGGLIPLYPSTEELAGVGLDSAGFRRVIHGVVRDHLDEIPDTLPPEMTERRSLAPLSEALRAVHFPRTAEQLQDGLRRLKYEELFRFQLKLALKRRFRQESARGIEFSTRSPLARQLVDSLPFALTSAQVRVVREITADMQLAKQMHRLLQGDVGSGKTVVALIAMLIAVDNGYQALFMAPTEILAEQHYRTLTRLAGPLSVSIRLLIGGQRARLRRDVLDDLQRGSAGIVVGTHALLQDPVRLARLGLVVIDEQHRFGVLQRAAVRSKGENPDVLVMTATPIPRTLSLTLYGDLDVSVLDEMPQGRRPVQTVLRPDGEKESVYRFVREQVGRGRQAYFVYPLIEESERVDLKAATVHFNELQGRVFPDLKLGLLHGRMGTEQKEEVMRLFVAGEINILVATTVIEVGVDVPNATVMVIENAERFGLAQLHQLRGRVGRGSDQSFCILLTSGWIARRAGRAAMTARALREETDARLAERRLATMVRTTDGFQIAEEDLQIRGPGDFFGTRQSGIPAFRVANLLTDSDLLKDAREDAFDLVRVDPHLRATVHRPLADDLRVELREDADLLTAG